MDTPSKTLFPTEFRPVAPAPPLDAVEPLACDRWLAASALQKAIRRADALTAGRAVRTLYRYDPRSAWRRLLVVAYEKFGIGALDAGSQRQCAARKPAAKRHFQVSPPSVHQMVLTLERAGLIRRIPGVPRSIELLIEPEDLPVLR
ncbi:MAG: hypothetical protein WBQ45_00825 [Roseiarcus sp.]